eukprot:scaffold159_cov318-Alexandrium_tamarense.AAC.6
MRKRRKELVGGSFIERRRSGYIASATSIVGHIYLHPPYAVSYPYCPSSLLTFVEQKHTSHHTETMASYYNPSKRLSEWAAASLSPYIRLESESPSRHAAAAADLPNQTNNSNSSHAQLSVGIWSGNVQLNNVELRPEAFEHFLNGSSAPPSKDSSNGG